MQTETAAAAAAVCARILNLSQVFWVKLGDIFANLIVAAVVELISWRFLLYRKTKTLRYIPFIQRAWRSKGR